MRRSLLVLAVLLYAAATVQLVNLTGSPAPTVAEGVNVAHAFALQRTGALLYPPALNELSLGWWQLAAYTDLTDAFDRTSGAVAAGREAMILAHVVACGMLWLLARRIGLSRAGAAGAVALYVISPLAIEYHRLVLLDNLAVPWLLAAFVLGTIRRMRGLTYCGAIVCFAAAVATRPTFAILLPVLVWQLWRGVTWREGRLPRLVTGAVAVVASLGYLAVLFRWGELVPGDARTNIWGDLASRLYGVVGQLGDASTLLRLDPILPALGAVTVLAGLRLPWLRPFSVGVLVQVAFWLGPGVHPETYVIGIIPLVALLIAGVVDAAVRAGAKKEQPIRRRPLAMVAVGVVVVNAILVAWFWPPSYVAIYTDHQDRPRYAAASWIATNARPADKIIVDDAMWVDLVVAGVDQRRLVSYARAREWRTFQYVVAVPAGSLRAVQPAVDSSQSHAAFGPPAQRVEVRRILPQGRQIAQRQQRLDAVDRVRAGRELASNVRLHLDAAARSALFEAKVDPRLLSVLALLAGAHALVVYEFPPERGEESTGALRRSVLIAAVDGKPVVDPNGHDSAAVRAIMGQMAVQLPRYRPASMEVRVVSGHPVLEIRYRPPSPTGMPK